MKTKEKIIDPISTDVLLSEISKLNCLGKTNFGCNLIYITDAHESLNIMKEIGRIRETAFRFMGGGSGKSVDIDQYDTMGNPFKQIFIWDPENNQITGVYRYILMKNLSAGSPTSHLFHLENDFETNIKPYAIELGRSCINIESKRRLHALHNLWDGIGYLMYKHPDIRYLFGKMTLYPWNLLEKFDLLLSFLEEIFPTDGSVKSKEPVKFNLIKFFDKGAGYNINYSNLRQKFKEGERKSIPPLVNSYMNLSETMKFFGASVNASFGNVVEGAILVTIADVNPKILDMHMAPFKK